MTAGLGLEAIGRDRLLMTQRMFKPHGARYTVRRGAALSIKATELATAPERLAQALLNADLRRPGQLNGETPISFKWAQSTKTA